MRSQKLETARGKLRLAKQIYGRVHCAVCPSTGRANPSIRRATIDREQEGLLRVGASHSGLGFVRWVADGIRTRNNQNHNLELYH